MISWAVGWPALGAVVAGLAAGLVQARLRPSLAAMLLTLLAGVAGLASVSVVAIVTGVFLAQVTGGAVIFDWCLSLTPAHRVPVALGATAVGAAVAMAGSILLAVGRLRVRRRRQGSTEELVVLSTDVPTAFAVPGRPGQIVVSTGMLRRLDGGERQVLLAHERAHLRHNHHRYLWVATVAAAAAPPLRPLLNRVRFAVERWADEQAVQEVGDRRLVARAIARAALLQADAPVLAFGGHGVRARVDALLDVPTRRGFARTATASVLAATMAAVAGSALQLHHLAALVAHACPGA